MVPKEKKIVALKFKSGKRLRCNLISEGDLCNLKKGRRAEKETFECPLSQLFSLSPAFVKLKLS